MRVISTSACNTQKFNLFDLEDVINFYFYLYVVYYNPNGKEKKIIFSELTMMKGEKKKLGKIK